MSTHILDQLAAVKIPAARSGYHDDLFILAAQGGDNNVRTHDGKRAREWYAIAAGAKWRVMGALVRMSSDMEGGMLKLAGNSRATSETLISKARKTVEAAPDFDDPSAPIYLDETAITFDDEEKVKRNYNYEKAVKTYGTPARHKKYLRGEVDVFPFDSWGADARAYATFIDHLPDYDRSLWHHFKVRARAPLN